MKIQVFCLESDGTLRFNRSAPFCEATLESIERETGNVYLQAGLAQACDSYLERVAKVMSQGRTDVFDATAAALMAAQVGTALALAPKVPGIEAPLFLRRRVPRRKVGWLCDYLHHHPEDARIMEEKGIRTVADLEAALPSLPCGVRRRVSLWSWRDAVAATLSRHSTGLAELARDIDTLAGFLPPWSSEVPIDVPRRTRNALAMGQIRTFGDLPGLGIDRLLGLKGFGLTGLRALRDALANFEDGEAAHYATWCEKGASRKEVFTRLFVDTHEAQGDIPPRPPKDMPHVAVFMLEALERLDRGRGAERRDAIFRSRLLGHETLQELAVRYGVTREWVRMIGENTAKAIHQHLRSELVNHEIAATYQGFLGLGKALAEEQGECAAIYLKRIMGERPGVMEDLNPATARLVATALFPDAVPLVVAPFRGYPGVLVPSDGAAEPRVVDLSDRLADAAQQPLPVRRLLVEHCVREERLPSWFGGVIDALLSRRKSAA
jgi:hypothetical protein